MRRCVLLGVVRCLVLRCRSLVALVWCKMCIVARWVLLFVGGVNVCCMCSLLVRFAVAGCWLLSCCVFVVVHCCCLLLIVMLSVVGV